MTFAPRQLSDAIKADYDEILNGRNAERESIVRWTVVRNISGWAALAAAVLPLFILLFGLVTWWFPALGFAAALFFFAPLVVIPAAVAWVVSLFQLQAIEARRREHMFTVYGITIDEGVRPAVYSVAGIPREHLKPELHRTRAIFKQMQDEQPAVPADAEEKEHAADAA